jgi:hypothetical protein
MVLAVQAALTDAAPEDTVAELRAAVVRARRPAV